MQHLSQVNPFYLAAIFIVAIVVYAPYRWDVEPQARRIGSTSPDAEIARKRAERALAKYPYAQRQFIWGANFRQETDGIVTVIATRRLILSQFVLEIALVLVGGIVLRGILRRA